MGQGFLKGQGGGKKTAKGTFTANNQNSVTISGVGFQPTGIALFWDGSGATSQANAPGAVLDNGTNNISINYSPGSNAVQSVTRGTTFTANTDGFSITNFASLNFINGTWRWIAWKD